MMLTGHVVITRWAQQQKEGWKEGQRVKGVATLNSYFDTLNTTVGRYNIMIPHIITGT
jgi:hypothetical protein